MLFMCVCVSQTFFSQLFKKHLSNEIKSKPAEIVEYRSKHVLVILLVVLGNDSYDTYDSRLRCTRTNGKKLFPFLPENVFG